jgi:hypothetical protein
VLGTLDGKWHQYVDFHVNTLGCRFCRANLDDIQAQNAQNRSTQLRTRIMESTAGFLQKSL